MTATTLDTRRREQIGGSEAASACGIDPYRSRRLLWYEKVHGIEREESEAMRLGTLLQGRIAEMTAVHGYEIVPAPAEGFVHRELPWMIVHPDGFTEIDGLMAVVEIKTRGTGWSSEDEHELFPYIMQVQHGMAVTACAVGALVVFHGGHGGFRLETRVVERDDALIERMIALEQEIVNAVRTLQPPPARGAKSDDESLKAEFPVSNGSAIRATGDVWTWVKEARLLKEQQDEVARQYKERVQNIQAFMGEAEQLVSPFDDQACRWPTVQQARFATKRFAEAHRSLYTEFLEHTTGRRFYLT